MESSSSAVLEPLLKGVGTSDNLEERIRTLREQILSRNLIERVIKKLDLDLNTKNPEKYEALIEGIRKKTTVTSKSFGGATAFPVLLTQVQTLKQSGT